MHLKLVISSLSCGGAERVISIMANYWAKKGWKIDLLTFDNDTKAPFYELDYRIAHIPLGVKKDSPNILIALKNNLKRIRVLRSKICNNKPDAVISFVDKTNIITILATRGLKMPVVVSERTDPAMFAIGRIWEQLRYWIYPLANRLVVQTKGSLSYFSLQQQTHSTIIPNPVLRPTEEKPVTDKLLTEQSLIALGRLSSEKDFDLLIKAFACLKDVHSEWTLTILGEGLLRRELETLCQQLGLSKRVNLLGQVKNPYQYLKQADIFVMSSRFEGFPNALCEAMACGLAVIATDCPSGPREIIRDGIDGVLVPSGDVSELAAAIDHLISDEGERKRLATLAPEVLERFSLEKVMEMWEDLLSQVIKEHLPGNLTR